MEVKRKERNKMDAGGRKEFYLILMIVEVRWNGGGGGGGGTGE